MDLSHRIKKKITKINKIFTVNLLINLSSVLFVHNHIYPTPPLGQDMTRGQFLSGV